MLTVINNADRVLAELIGPTVSLGFASKSNANIGEVILGILPLSSSCGSPAEVADLSGVIEDDVVPPAQQARAAEQPACLDNVVERVLAELRPSSGQLMTILRFSIQMSHAPAVIPTSRRSSGRILLKQH